jgi:hypothetical protein
VRRVADALGGIARLGIDTSPVIYLIESSSQGFS